MPVPGNEKEFNEVKRAFFAKSRFHAFVVFKTGVGRQRAAKIRLKGIRWLLMQKNDKGEVQLRTPQEISSYCNSTSPAMKYLIGVYQLHKASIKKNKEAMAAFW